MATGGVAIFARSRLLRLPKGFSDVRMVHTYRFDNRAPAMRTMFYWQIGNGSKLRIVRISFVCLRRVQLLPPYIVSGWYSILEDAHWGNVIAAILCDVWLFQRRWRLLLPLSSISYLLHSPYVGTIAPTSYSYNQFVQIARYLDFQPKWVGTQCNVLTMNISRRVLVLLFESMFFLILCINCECGWCLEFFRTSMRYYIE